MARILFLTSYYPPEKGAAAVRVSETAACLRKRGHQVTVLTAFPNYPTGIIPPEYRGHVIQKETVDGVRLVRVWSYVTANKGFLRRILAQFSFGCLAAILGWRDVGHPDVIIVESHPLFNAISGRLLSWLKRRPFVFMVSDLWPESAVQLGLLRNHVFIWLAERLEWSTYKRSSFVWALTEGIRSRLIERGLLPEHIFLLTNGVDTTKFRPIPSEQARTELSWDDRFTVLYAGTHGPSHGLMTLLDAAEQLKDIKEIHFILAGDGAEKASLVAHAQKRNLSNVTFLDAQPHDRIPLLLAAANVSWIHWRKLPVFEGGLPLKMFEAMGCGRPILLGIDGEPRRLAEQKAGAAIHFESGNSKALVEGILYLKNHPEEAALLGQRGREFVEAWFDRDQLTAELDARIAGLLGKKRAISSLEASIPESLPTTPISHTIEELDTLMK